MRHGIRAAAIATLTCLASPVVAQDFLGSYFTTIGPEDFYNSRGVWLSDACAVLQQDRANFHRFGIRHQGDQPDPFFTSTEARGVIGRDCRLQHQGQAYVARALRDGVVKYVMVQVYGYGGRPAFVTFQEGAG